MFYVANPLRRNATLHHTPYTYIHQPLILAPDHVLPPPFLWHTPPFFARLVLAAVFSHTCTPFHTAPSPLGGTCSKPPSSVDYRSMRPVHHCTLRGMKGTNVRFSQKASSLGPHPVPHNTPGSHSHTPPSRGQYPVGQRYCPCRCAEATAKFGLAFPLAAPSKARSSSMY